MKTLTLLVILSLTGFSVGVPNINQIGFPTGRIVGGNDADPHQAPFIVSLQRIGLFGGHFCGGSIIGREWIITAGHCLTISAKRIRVVAGFNDMRGTKHGSQSKLVNFYTVHEKYSGSVGPFDIGLINLAEPLDFNEYVKAIKLPESDYIHKGESVLFGWGSISQSIFPSYPRRLQTVKKPILEYNKCEEVLGGRGESPLHETNICTGPLTGGISACSGDSGGPLTQVMDNGIYELIGIVSWGFIPCGSTNSPSVYTRTSAYIEWIHEQQNLIENF